MFPTIDEFNEMLSEILDELPEEFFVGLSGGIVVEEEIMIADYAKANELYTMGMYKVNHCGNQIVLYYGSFQHYLNNSPEEIIRSRMRDVVRHEFRHHLEYRSGVHGIDSLEAEDEREKEAYLKRFKK